MINVTRARNAVCIGNYTVVDYADIPPEESDPQQPGRIPLRLHEAPFLCDPEWRRYYVLEGALKECGLARTVALQLCRCSYFRMQFDPSANRLAAPRFWLDRQLPAYDRYLSIPSYEYTLVRLFVPLPRAFRYCRYIATNPVPESVMLREFGETGLENSDLETSFRLEGCHGMLEFVGQTLTAIWAFAEARHLDLRDLGDHYNSPSEVLMDRLLAFRQAMVDFNTREIENDVRDSGIKKEEAYADMTLAINDAEEMIRRVLQDTKERFWAQWPVPTQTQLEGAAARVTFQSPVPCDICAM